MKLSEAINKITNQFGKDVLTEERFVNILADLYPNRDNPAVFSIIRTLVKDGCCSDLLACNKINVQTFISKSALALNKKYGYDKTLVEETLNLLAAGCGVTVPKNVNQPAPKPAPSKQTSQKPAKPQNQPPTKPATQPKPAKQPKQKNNQQPNQIRNQSPKRPLTSYKINNFFYLVLSFLGLFVAPVVYLLAITGNWWPSFTLFLILIIQAIIFTISYQKLVKHKPLPVIGGSFSAIILCAVIFLAFAPFYAESDSTKEAISFMGISYNHEMAFPLVTLIISIYYFGFVNIGGRIAGYDLTLIIDHLTEPYSSGKVGIDKLISNKQFMKGFILSGLFILMVGMFIVNLPTIDSWRVEFNNSLLRAERNKMNKQLSFADFMIGSDFDSCISSIKSLPNYSYNDMYNCIQSIQLIDDSEMTPDTTISIKTKWYNDSIDIYLHSWTGKLMAIEIDIISFDTDSILALFSSKYGKPEYSRIKERPLGRFFYTENWKWVYENGVIIINDKKIIYYDRKLETIAALKKEKEIKEKEERDKKELIEKQEVQAIQRKRDSLNRIKMLEEERKKQLERKKAIDQI